MSEKEQILVVAYAIYPEIKSSEGIVNDNWIQVINNDLEVLYISLLSTIEYDKVRNQWKTVRSQKLQKNYLWAKNKFSLGGIWQRILNRVIKNKYRFPHHVFLWKNKQLPPLITFIKQQTNTVVWARVLPTHSLALLLEAYKKQPFPIVLNINDPIEKNRVNEYDLFIQLKNHIQCFTFPSWALAKQTATAHQLDISKCFVLPHAMAEQPVLYGDVPREKNAKVKIVYTGTFYKSAFTREFQEGLQRFMKSTLAKNVSFTWILSQYDAASIIWLQNAIPDVEILTKLDRNEVLKVVASADVMMVVDAESHKNLLKGKLAEAISFGIPILGISYKDAVIDKVLKQYGTPCAYQNEPGDVLKKLELVIKNTIDPEWVSQFKQQRTTVMQQFSGVSIAKNTYTINQFAKARFQSIQNGNDAVSSPFLDNWP